MSTLLAAADQSAIVARLQALTPTMTPGWGTLNAPRMICHVSDQLRVALGVIPVQKRVDTLARRTVLKWVILWTGFEPPHGKVQTVPEMLVSSPGAWGDDIRECERLIGAVGRGAASAVHPAFGPLTPREWGTLCWKHLHYHLKQFGA
jgi:hypothetical protein